MRFDEQSMRALRGGISCFLILACAGWGCRAPREFHQPGVPPPRLVQPPALEPVPPVPIEPDLARLPTVDPLGPVPGDPETFLGLSEAAVQCRAAARSAIANLLDAENARPLKVRAESRTACMQIQADGLTRRLRSLAGLEARNRAAAEALERWLQLAEAQGRRDLFAAGVATFDRLRDATPKFHDASLPTLSEAEILRQRATLLAGLQGVDGAIALLNADLSGKLGRPLETGEHFRPTGDFSIQTELIDADDAVKTALLNRPELLMLRTAHQQLSAGNLPAVRAQLQSLHGLAAMSPTDGGMLARLRAACGGRSDGDTGDELAARRAQIAELLVQREMQAEIEVRAAIGQMSSTARRVGLLVSRAASFGEQLEAARNANKLADVLNLENELLKARSDVLAAVIEWHQWRIRLKAAQGTLALDCFD